MVNDPAVITHPYLDGSKLLFMANLGRCGFTMGHHGATVVINARHNNIDDRLS